MTLESVYDLLGSCLAAGLVVGAVIALVNSWRV